MGPWKEEYKQPLKAGKRQINEFLLRVSKKNVALLTTWFYLGQWDWCWTFDPQNYNKFFFFTFFFLMSAIFEHPFRLTPTSEHYLCALTLLCSRAPLSPRGEILHIPGTLFIFVCLFCFLSDDRVFVAATQRIPLDHLPLEAGVG